MKYIQSYFECFKESGINTIFHIYRMRGNRKLTAIAFDHCTHDGVSAVLEMARSFPAQGFVAPQLNLKPKPSVWKRLLELLKWYGRFYPFTPAKWKVLSSDKQDIASGITKVEGWNFPHPISLNSRLLLALDQTSRDYLADPLGNTHWMTPVGMYDGISRELTPANRVSFIDLKLTPLSTLESVQTSAKMQLQAMNYWGTILTMYFSVMLGKKPFVLFSRYLHLFFRRTGTFSNVGEWKIPGLPEDEWWVFGQGCVARMSPVEATALVINGHLGISVHAHQSLGWSKEEAQRFVERWKENYLATARS